MAIAMYNNQKYVTVTDEEIEESIIFLLATKSASRANNV